MKVEINNLKELEKFAFEFSKHLKGNETIGLKGPLGAGKTTFTKGIGKALKVKEEIISPTFNIVKVYDSILGPLYHIDCYRLENLGYDPILDDYLFDDKAIKVVEWYNFLEEDLFTDAIKIEIAVINDKRILNIEGICLD